MDDRTGEATARSKNQHRFYSDSTYTHIARICKGLLAVSEERATQDKDVNRPYRKITPNRDRVQLSVVGNRQASSAEHVTAWGPAWGPSLGLLVSSPLCRDHTLVVS